MVLRISNKNQGFNKKKRVNLNPENDPDFERKQAIIKEKLDRRKNTGSGLHIDDIRGGSPLELQERERIREAERKEREALLNATPSPGTQPPQAPVSQIGQTQGNTRQNNMEVSPQAQAQEVIKPNDAGEGFLPGLREKINEFGGVPDRGELPPQASPADAGRGVLGVTAKIADALRTAVSGKSSKQLTSAEEVMNTYMSALAEDITLYQQGIKSFDDVLQNVKQAEASINLYESNLVGEGKRNLNYWIDKGARIEANVIAQRDRLADFKTRLLNTTQTPQM